MPIRKLRELAKKVGARVFNMHDRTDIQDALDQVGAVEEPMAESIDAYWKIMSRFVGDGPVSAIDPEGWFSANIYPDGSADITAYNPSLHNRKPGSIYANDVTVKIPSVERFAIALMLLTNEADQIFEETSAVIAAKSVPLTPEEIQAEIEAGYDPRLNRLAELAIEYGMVGANKPNDSEMPYKIASALGISTMTDAEDQAPALKDWNTMLNEVVGFGAEVEPDEDEDQEPLDAEEVPEAKEV